MGVNVVDLNVVELNKDYVGLFYWLEIVVIIEIYICKGLNVCLIVWNFKNLVGGVRVMFF